MPKIAVFDLDGTLTDTSAVDANCFLAALRKTFDLGNESADWHSYEHVTDSNILAEIVNRATGSEPDHQQTQQFIDCFVELLDAAHHQDASQFSEIPGAVSFLGLLRSQGWTVTVATGGWRASALRKLQHGGFHALGLPLATANDARTRKDIVTVALRRVGVNKIENGRTIVFGDAMWDLTTAQSLDIPLIGVANGSTAEELRAAGAHSTIVDYTQSNELLDLMTDLISSNQTQ